MTFRFPGGGSGCSQPGDAAAPVRPSRAGGGRRAGAATKVNTLPLIEPVGQSTEGTLSCTGGLRSSDLVRDGRLAAEVQDSCGRHFLFDRKYDKLDRTRTQIPPLPKDYQVHRARVLHPLSLRKELPPGQAAQPFTLCTYRGFDPNMSPVLLLPSALVLNRRNTFSVENCHLSRPKVNYRLCNLGTIGENQKYADQSYPDPVAGAPQPFVQRVSELSSLQGEAVRQEKLRKMRKSRKQDY